MKKAIDNNANLELVNSLAVIKIGDVTRFSNNTVPESQLTILADSAQTITSLQSALVKREQNAQALKTKIAQNDDIIKLKREKTLIKLIKTRMNDATNRYNGVIETVLAEVPGADIEEKLTRLGTILLEAKNG